MTAALFFAAGYFVRSPGELADEERVPDDIRLRRLTFSGGLAHEPSVSPDGNYVAYTSDVDGNLDISVLPLAGGNIQRVVKHPADDAQPRWSPDGTRLAFTSARDQGGRLSVIGGVGSLSESLRGNGGDVFLMPAMGGTPTKLAEQACYPSWAPDGQSVVYQSIRNGSWNIWRISSGGGRAVQLTDDTEINYQPAWSPDGKWIVFCAGIPFRRLCLIPAGGGEKTVLYEGSCIAPAWSPDGRWIYFSSDRASVDGDMDIWRVAFDPGGGPVTNPQRVTSAAAKELGATLAADGTSIVFGELNESPDIWRLDVSSGALEQLTTAASAENYPHLSPDGETLIMSSDRSGDARLWTLNLRTQELLQLETPQTAFSPRWSADGSRIAYAGVEDDEVRLFVRHIGGIQATRIGTTTLQGPDWSRDGTKLVAYTDGIWLSDLDAGTSIQLTRDDDATFPAISPDGQVVAFQKDRSDEARELWAVSVEGGEPWLIAGGDVEYSHPHWNPVDADRILVVVDHKELAVVHVSSGEVEFVTSINSSTSDVDYPTWSHDGQQVYFSIIRRSGDLYMIEGL